MGRPREKFEPLEYQIGYQQERKPLGISDKDKEWIDKAFKSTPAVFRLLSTLRSRRFGMGYRFETGEPETFTWSHGKTVVQETGPTPYKSEKEPRPLSELEEAILAWSALGPNGVIFADLPVQANMSTWLCWAGRTIPAPCNDSAVDLIIINDTGSYLYRPIMERLKLVEIENEEDYWKILAWYKEDRIQIMDRRPDVGWMMGPSGTNVNLMGPWQYNVNRPGSTWFIPVGDAGFEWFNILFSLYEWWHVYLMDPDTGEPAGCREWVKPGYLEMGMSIPMFDELLAMVHAYQVGCCVQNLRLACEALGLGAWVFCGYVDDLVLGGMPELAKGLGFQYMQRDPNKNPHKILTSIGLPGIKEATVTPSPQYPTPEDVVSYVKEIRYKRGAIFSRKDNWALRHNGPYKPEIMKKILEHPRLQISDWVYDAVLATVKYIVDKWGVAPAFTNPIQANFSCQVHHLDIDYYRTYFSAKDGGEPFGLTDRILNHFKAWHPGESDPYEK